MKLLIDIDGETYKRICEAQSVPDMQGTDIVNAINRIRRGKPYEEIPQGISGVSYLHQDSITKSDTQIGGAE